MNKDSLLLEYLYAHAPIIAVEFDSEGRLRWANDFTRNSFGPDVIGSSVDDFFVTFDQQFDLENAAQNSESTHMLNVSTSGLPQTYYFNFYRLTDGTLAVGRVDITELDSLRTELVKSNNQLNNLTRELNKKNAELSRLNEIKNHFLGMAAHDLRNPLVSIMGFSGFMKGEPDAFKRPEFLELLNDIHSLSEFMLALVNDLLDISVIESGKLKIRLEYEFFRPVLQKVVDIHKVIAQEYDIDMRLIDDLPDGVVKFDGPRIKQVLNNLVSNAIKFSPRGSVINVRAFVENDNLRVSVEDHGSGIPAESISKLFRPYQKIGTVSPHREKQTGLGLAISKKIIVAHHGSIWVESEEGKGSVFHFSLPDFRGGLSHDSK